MLIVCDRGTSSGPLTGGPATPVGHSFVAGILGRGSSPNSAPRVGHAPFAFEMNRVTIAQVAPSSVRANTLAETIVFHAMARGRQHYHYNHAYN